MGCTYRVEDNRIMKTVTKYKPPWKNKTGTAKGKRKISLQDATSSLT
jgi:hypothetical protein